jgi:hypothetical protein
MEHSPLFTCNMNSGDDAAKEKEEEEKGGGKQTG